MGFKVLKLKLQGTCNILGSGSRQVTRDFLLILLGLLGSWVLLLFSSSLGILLWLARSGAGQVTCSLGLGLVPSFLAYSSSCLGRGGIAGKILLLGCVFFMERVQES